MVYAYFSWSTRSPVDDEAYYQAVGKLRMPLFLLLLLGLGTMFAFTIPRTPYPKGQIPTKIVHVVGKQFQFALSENPIRTEEEFAQSMVQRLKVPIDEWIEFRVTSLDVNHAFGIYDSDGNLIAQTQAMPSYVNRLLVRLDKPGTYTVLCLEYCGLSHHIMRASFEATAAGQ
jgi:cytochrome c oxidase subunit 2